MQEEEKPHWTVGQRYQWAGWWVASRSGWFDILNYIVQKVKSVTEIIFAEELVGLHVHVNDVRNDEP